MASMKNCVIVPIYSTLFVDNIPNVVNNWWLCRAFNRCGQVVDAFIPSKRRKQTKSRFGFVRYKNLNDARKAMHLYNGASLFDVVFCHLAGYCSVIVFIAAILFITVLIL